MDNPRDVQLSPGAPGKLAWLVLLVLLWAVFGMTGRDAWQEDEVQAFGYVLGWLNHGRIPVEAPLYTWTAALLARLLARWYDWQDAARWASTLYTLTAMAFTAAAARRLFGPGFGAVATLLLMGTFGLLLRVHALLPETAILAGYALLLYGLSTVRTEADGGWAVTLGGLILLLTRGLPDLAAGVACAGAMFFLPGEITRSYRESLIKSALILAAAILGWLLWLYQTGHLATWWAYQMASLGEVREPGNLISVLGWFAWPIWPLALWAVWHEHRRLDRPTPLHLPLVAAVAAFLASHFPAYSSDGSAMPLLVPLTLLAAYGIATLKRGAAQAFYWFGVVTFVFFALAFWVYFSAMEWGWPVRLAARLVHLNPDYEANLPWTDILVAAGASLAWLVAVPLFPRAQLRPALVWATGMTLSWVLLIALFSPWIETFWGYRPIAAQVSQRVPASACVSLDLKGPERVMMAYHLAPLLPRAGRQCGWRLALGNRDTEPEPGETLVWEGARPRYKQRLYLLYREGAAHGAP
jgi:hypothetical protein